MHFVKTKLFVTLMGVVCLSLVGGYLGITLLSTTPIHAYNPRQGGVGGCGETASSQGDAVEACISLDNGTIKSDGYVSGECASVIRITLEDLTDHMFAVQPDLLNVCGHFPGPSESVKWGDVYIAHVITACFPRVPSCLFADSKQLG
jgi:hypothetical protein